MISMGLFDMAGLCVTRNMTKHPCTPTLATLTLLASLSASPAFAQNWSFDARRIALGGIGSTENGASRMVEEERRYRSIAIPLGLVQVLSDMDVFNPDSDQFGPVRAMELAASPLHYTFGRETNDAGSTFVADLVNAGISRDLNRYRGFTPASSMVAEGLASPSWGKTFVVRGSRDSFFQGVYAGAGPYFSVRTEATLDPALIEILSANQDRYVPNTTFRIDNDTAQQVALAVTGGYRAKFALAGGGGSTSRDGVYVSANYHYLRGFRYDDFDLAVRLDTDAAGLLTIRPTTTPIEIDRLASTSGNGFALDFGAAVALDRWDFGFGASGVANRINWSTFDRQRLVLSSIFDGGEFTDITLPALDQTRRVELPTTYSADGAYHADRWSVVSEYAHGFQGHNFRSGLEYRLNRIEVRGGARYSRDRWHPSVGAGFDVTSRLSVDVAAFGTSANIERRRDTALAISLRLNH